MWKIFDWIKSLLGGSLTAQFGLGNQVSSGAMADHNSAVVTAGRDVNINTSESHDATIIGSLEATIPIPLDRLREALSEDPLVRIMIIVDKTSIAYRWPEDHIKFSEDETPGIRKAICVLENHELVSELDERFAYRISERLAKYLLRSNKVMT